jgi:carbamoyl-phosphate synthase large subunit
MGFGVYTTGGTAEFLRTHSIKVETLKKIAEGARPNVLDLLKSGEIHLVINTPTRTGWNTDEGKIRATATRMGVPMITTASGAKAAVRAIEALRAGDWQVAALQDYANHAPSPANGAATVGV